MTAPPTIPAKSPTITPPKIPALLFCTSQILVSLLLATPVSPKLLAITSVSSTATTKSSLLSLANFYPPIQIPLLSLFAVSITNASALTPPQMFTLAPFAKGAPTNPRKLTFYIYLLPTAACIHPSISSTAQNMPSSAILTPVSILPKTPSLS